VNIGSDSPPVFIGDQILTVIGVGTVDFFKANEPIGSLLTGYGAQ
jgi:hypothetical protein